MRINKRIRGTRNKIGLTARSLYKIGDRIKNVIIFIDYENIHKILIKNYENLIEKNFIEKLKIYCIKNNLNPLSIIAYCNFDRIDLNESFHQTYLQSRGVDTEHTPNNGKNYADLQITIDANEEIHNNRLLDGIVIVSSDKDMIPLIKHIKKYKEFVYLITTKEDFNRDVSSYATKHAFLDEIFNIKIYEENPLRKNIYENLNNYIAKLLDKGESPVIKCDHFVDGVMKWFKVYKYEIMRNLSLLEQDGKVFVYNYRWKDGKTYTGVVTDLYVSHKDIDKNEIKSDHFKWKIRPTYDDYNR